MLNRGFGRAGRFTIGGRDCPPGTTVTCPYPEFGIRIEAMRLWTRLTITTVFCGTILCCSWAQVETRHVDGDRASRQSNSALRSPGADQEQNADRAQTQHAPNQHGLNEDDRLSLIAAALDSRVRRHSEPDCSHLVHAIYQQAGFPYAYAPSSDLYGGSGGFQRIKQPQPGDLIVWRGHVGMVIKPSEHIFFSFLRSGPGTDDYESPYWKSRGRPRFYRYVKNSSCDGCDAAHSRRLLKIKR